MFLSRFARPLTALAVATTLAVGGCASDEDAGTDDEGTDGMSEAAAEDNLTQGCANCIILPQKSIRSIAIDMTEKEVRHTLGKPNSVSTQNSELVGRFKTLKYGKTEVSIGQDHKVFSVFTFSERVKTADGVGVGSPEADVAAKVAGAKCQTISGFRTCTVGKIGAGEISTSFAINANKVVSVSLAVTID